MRLIPVLFSIAAAGLCAGVAVADPDDSRLEPAFGNTVISTYPDGRTAKLWLQRDGSYTGQGRRGGGSSGRWTVKGDEVCLKQSRPIHAFTSFCTPLPSGGAGGSWAAKAVTGEQIRVRIVKGGQASKSGKGA